VKHDSPLSALLGFAECARHNPFTYGAQHPTLHFNPTEKHTMTITESLIQMSSDIADATNRHQLTDLEADLEVINDKLINGTDAEFALYNKCEAEAATASRFLADEYAQEERDQVGDEMDWDSYSSKR